MTVIDYSKRNEISELKLNSKLPNADICNVSPVFITDNDAILTLALTWHG